MGTVMPYAAVGAARTEAGLLGGPSTNETGWSLGLGAEFMVADQMSLRTEFSTVRFSNVGENVWLPPGAGDYSYDQFTIGLGWHF
jgi:opacity protein-like surface antigen